MVTNRYKYVALSIRVSCILAKTVGMEGIVVRTNKGGARGCLRDTEEVKDIFSEGQHSRRRRWSVRLSQVHHHLIVNFL